jgi:endonuclease/exonuclease/phosphatase family metal-dependent hydrolase
VWAERSKVRLRGWVSFLAPLLVVGGLLTGSQRGQGRASGKGSPSGVAPAKSAVPGTSPWSSPEACLGALAKRPPRPPRTARLAAWNVRWFPDGGPGRRRQSTTGHGAQPTHLEWLACAIAGLDVDVLAFEELKSTPEASDALSVVRAKLDALTGGSHRVEIDRCPGKGRQSVALLFDEKRVTASGFRNLDSLNPKGGGCEGQLRPGLGGYFRFPGGLDLHVVAVHLNSGPNRRAFDLRQVSLQGITTAFADAQAAGADDDLLILGDFNTMGCPECSPKVTVAEELAIFDGLLARLSPPFMRVPATLSCTEYYRGKGAPLDHFVIGRGTRELAPGTVSRVEGYCRDAACAPLPEGAMPRAYRELSDHCPVVLDLRDEDLD